MQLPPGQHRLQQVAGVHGPVGFAGAHDVVELVDEEQNASLAIFDFIQNSLQPLLELAPELGAGDQGAHIQGEDRFVLESLGHVPPEDPLGQSLGDGGLSHARLADQDGIVFGFSGQDPDHVSDLLVPADHRIQLLLPGLGHQVEAVFVQSVVGLLRIVSRHPSAFDRGQGFQEILLADAEILEEQREGGGGLFQERQEDVFHGNVFVPHGCCGLLRGCEHPVALRRHIDLVRFPPAAGHPGDVLQLVVQRPEKCVRIDAHFFQQRADQTAVLVQERVQQMFGNHLQILVFQGDILGAVQRLHGFLR